MVSREGSGVRGRLAIIAFALFLLVDAGLILALHHHLKKADDGAAKNGPAASLSPTPTKTETAPPKPNGAKSLTLTTTGILARVTRGKCADDGLPALDLSGNGGQVFRSVALPLLRDAKGKVTDKTLRTILLVRIDSATKMTIVGSDDACVARRFDSSDGGQSWSPSSTIKAWYVGPSDTSVASPTGASNPGCTVRALSWSSDSAAKALCSSGAIRTTTDHGSTWSTAGTLPGLTAGTFNGPLIGVAVAPHGSCKSSVFSSTDGGANWTAGGCISAKGGVTSIAGSSTRLFALVGTNVRVSTDHGKTWQ